MIIVPMVEVRFKRRVIINREYIETEDIPELIKELREAADKLQILYNALGEQEINMGPNKKWKPNENIAE